MISGSLPVVTIFNVTRIRAIVGAIFILAFSVARADGWQLPELMQLLAQNKAGKASFVENL